MDCSIIICTRNRAAMLEKTIHAFRSVEVPADWSVEMIVVDNGSTDHTAKVVKSASHSTMEIHYIMEAQPGKSRAQNTAMLHARGEALLFTDDDVEPANNWLEKMARPLLENYCKAVTGRIFLADELHRPWFKDIHKTWLAMEPEPSGPHPILIGASMGIHRSVFELLGNFDEELGPGASGFGEETLIWMQMKEAGLKIMSVLDTHVIHHPDASRLLRASWLDTAVRFGRTGAYVMHHWEHSTVRFPIFASSLVRVKLFLRSLCRRRPAVDVEGCPAWEISYIAQIATIDQFLIESAKDRNYELRGFQKKK